VKIGIFNEPKGLAFGGTEFCVATLAKALGARHDVVILHRKKEMPLEKIERFYGSPIPSTKVLPAPACPKDKSLERGSWQQARHEFRHDRTWTANYDLFVAFTHNIPPFCLARTGVLIVLFPVGQRPVASNNAGFSIRQRGRDALVQWYWRKRLGGYRFSLAISEFSREWTRTYWGVDCGILHPPCRTMPRPATKEDIILSVGRFTPLKRQTALVKAYILLEPHIPRSWSYRSVGSLALDETAYYREVAALAEGSRVELRTDLPRDVLDREFRRAAIFWHGAGENESKESPPVDAEHFGITTVEAMSAGCVPVVHNKGGQREIVEHGVSGFLWDTVEELLSYTKELMADGSLRDKMAAAASQRAKSFSQEAFVSRFEAILAPALNLNS
jgi:glycosyltransferase involved in cell wall biosynthesis